MNLIGYFNEEDNKFHFIKVSYISYSSEVYDRLKNKDKIKELCNNGMSVCVFGEQDFISEEESNYADTIVDMLLEHDKEDLMFNYISKNINGLTKFDFAEWADNEYQSTEIILDKLDITPEFLSELCEANSMYSLSDSNYIFFRYKGNLFLLLAGATFFTSSIQTPLSKKSVKGILAQT